MKEILKMWDSVLKVSKSTLMDFIKFVALLVRAHQNHIAVPVVINLFQLLRHILWLGQKKILRAAAIGIHRVGAKKINESPELSELETHHDFNYL